MIIFGTRGVTMTPGTGAFYCPKCGPETLFGRKRVRRFFTLYFIPVIPLNVLGEYIECQRCARTYDEDVLSYNPDAGAEEVLAQFELTVRKVMIFMALADGTVDDDEIKVMATTYKQLFDIDVSAAEFRKEVDAVSQESMTAIDYLKEAGANLNAHGKEQVIKAMYVVAAADGDFDQTERKLLSEGAAALDMSKAHLNGILDEMMQEK